MPGERGGGEGMAVYQTSDVRLLCKQPRFVLQLDSMDDIDILKMEMLNGMKREWN